MPNAPILLRSLCSLPGGRTSGGMPCLSAPRGVLEPGGRSRASLTRHVWRAEERQRHVNGGGGRCEGGGDADYAPCRRQRAACFRHYARMSLSPALRFQLHASGPGGSARRLVVRERCSRAAPVFVRCTTSGRRAAPLPRSVLAGCTFRKPGVRAASSSVSIVNMWVGACVSRPVCCTICGGGVVAHPCICDGRAVRAAQDVLG